MNFNTIKLKTIYTCHARFMRLVEALGLKGLWNLRGGGVQF